AIAGRVYREFLLLLGVQIEQIQVASIFEDDGIWSEAWPVHIKVGEVRELIAAQAVAVQVQAVFRTSIRVEIDRVAVPHGKSVGPFGVRHLLDVIGFEVVNPDVLGHAAGIALPSAEISEDAVVGNLVPVWRKGCEATFVERQRLRQTTVDAHRIQPSEPVIEGISPAQENNPLAVRSPSNDFVMNAHALIQVPATGMESQLPRLSAF